MNENENTTTQNLWDTVKAVLRGRFIATQAYLKKQEKSQISNLTLPVAQTVKCLPAMWETLGFFIFSFSSCFRCRVRLFIWLFSCFLRYACIAMNFPLSTAFRVSHRFWVVVFSFSFISMHILISFLISFMICWLFSSVFFSLHLLEFLIVFLL